MRNAPAVTLTDNGKVSMPSRRHGFSGVTAGRRDLASVSLTETFGHVAR
jgi:hypothetical protein